MEDAADYPSWHWVWHAYIGGMCAAAVIAVYLLDDRLTARSPLGAAIALAAMVAWLTIAGRAVPRLGPLGWRPVTYVCVAVGLWTFAMWCAPAAVAAIPALYPVVFSTLPLGPAIGASVVVTLVPLALDIAVSGFAAPHFPVVVAMALIGLVAAPIIGTVIVTAVRQRIRLTTLIGELERSRAETSRLSREAGIAAERARLAGEIHDTLAQGFTSIVTLAQAIEVEFVAEPAAAKRHLHLIEATARENLTEARTMVTQLTPSALDGATLPAAIRRQCEAFSAESAIELELNVDDPAPPLGMAADVVLLRVAQEALANVRRHARATRVRVDLTVDDEAVRLSLSDNGIGLSEGHMEGFGLRGIRTRVTQAGGRVSIGPTPGGGTTVAVEVPA